MRLLAALLFFTASFATAQNPALSGVLNAGDYTTDIAPGTIVSLYGQNLAAATSVASAVPLPTTIDGTSVELTAGAQTIALPLFFVSAGQINAQIPYGITGQWQARVRTARGLSASAALNILPCAPKLFTWTQDGKGEAVVLHADYSPVNTASPAQAGEVVIVYLTGLGEVNPPVAAGTPAGDGSAAAPVNLAVLEPYVTVAGQPARILFAGLAPYFAGLYQLNIEIPRTVPTGASRIAIVAGAKAAQGNVSVAVRSSWVEEKSAAFGPAGGTLTGSAGSAAFAAGALPSGTEVVLYRDLNPQFGANEAYRGSGVMGLAGVPDTWNTPLTLTTSLDRSAPAGSVPLMAVRIANRVVFLDATVNGTQASATIPAVPAPRPNAKLAASGLAANGMRSAWTFWAVTGYYALKSAKGHFRVIYPAVDLVEGGAEQIAEALETAYTKIESLGLDWSRRNGTLSWPIDVSIEWFEDDRKDRWGEEGSTKLGVQRQGINLNAHKMGNRDGIATMRIAAGHELFHLMQNLYDLESAPSTWLWMEEAASTWLERRLTTDASYVPGTVAPAAGGSTNYRFLVQRGLEYAPGNAESVQNHGYGASMFLESISRRHGEAAIARILKEMNVRGVGLFAGPRSSPVAAVHSVIGDVGVEWQQFCESYMARQVYGASPQFPTTDLIVAGGETYRWTSATDPGPRWEHRYQDLSARLFYLDLRGPQFPAGTKLTISLDGGGPAASAIVYRTSASGEWTRLALVRDVAYQISNAETLVAQGQRLAIMVVNSRAVAPYSGFTRLGLSVRTGDDLLSWLRQTRFFFWIARARLCFIDTPNGRESCSSEDPLLANDSTMNPATFQPSMAWNGRRFFLNGRTSVMHDRGGAWGLDIQGEVSEDGLTIKNVRMLLKLYDGAKVSRDWDIELFDYPLTSGAGATERKTYEPLRVTDWSKHVKIHKMSLYSSSDGRETRRFSRIESITSSWMILGIK